MIHHRVIPLLILVATLPLWSMGDRVSEKALASDLSRAVPFALLTVSGPVGQNAAEWTSTFDDEFDGTVLDRTKWRSDYWNGGNGEVQEYVDHDSHNNYIVQDGILSLVARNESYGRREYTSGIITTQGRFSQTYGFFEMRAKMPSGKGLWPAFWMMPNPTGWPPEIDVMEYLGHQAATVYMTFHYSGGSNQSYSTGPDFSANYHVFGVDWQPNAIVWYVDGVERKRYTDTARIPNASMFLLANLAVGGSWPGSPDATTVFPASFDIDYIRAWKKASPSTPTPAATSTPASGPTPNPTSTPPPANMRLNGTFEATGSSPWYSPWTTRSNLGAAFVQVESTAASGSRSSKATLSMKNSSQPWVAALMQTVQAL